MEEFPIHSLSLLPTVYRRNLLFDLPPADICTLQDTPFAEGIDFDKIWEAIFSTVFKVEFSNNGLGKINWKRRYLDKIFRLSFYGFNSPSPCEIHRSNRYFLLSCLFGMPYWVDRMSLTIPATSGIVTICETCDAHVPLRYAFLYHFEQHTNLEIDVRNVFEIINYLSLHFQYHPTTLEIINELFQETMFSGETSISIPTLIETANKHSKNLKEFFKQLKSVQLVGLPRKLVTNNMLAPLSSMYIVDKLIHSHWKCIESLEILPLHHEMSSMVHKLMPCISEGMPSLRNLTLSIDDTVSSSQLKQLVKPIDVLKKLDLYVKTRRWSEEIEHNIMILSQKALSGSIYVDLTDMRTQEFLKMKPFLKHKHSTRVHFIITFNGDIIESGSSFIVHCLTSIDGYLNAKLDKSVILKQKTLLDEQFFEISLDPIQVEHVVLNDENINLLLILNIKFEFLELYMGLTPENMDCLKTFLCHCLQEQIFDLKLVLNYIYSIGTCFDCPNFFADKNLFGHLVTAWRQSQYPYKFKSITILQYIYKDCKLIESELEEISEVVQITSQWRESFYTLV